MKVQSKSSLAETVSPGASTKPFLLVLGPDLFRAYDLPPSGSLLVGRSPDAVIWLDDALVSAEHARLTVGDGIHVEDLGSRNGTFLRQQRLGMGQRHRLEIGEALAIGSCLLVVQSAATVPRRGRAIGYGFFHLRLEEELARARFEKRRPFALARLRLPASSSSEAVEEVAAQVLRPFDTFSAFTPDEYAILFSETAGEDAASLLAQMTLTLSARGIEARAALARHPEHGRTAEQLEAYCRRQLRPQAEEIAVGNDVVAVSASMTKLYQQAGRIAASRIAVMISGETGAGKDVIARWIHQQSGRQPFVPVNCAALPETLFESLLFGHKKGAFSGATADHEGLVTAANGGTLFLDEIAEVPLAAQAKLLRVIESQEVQPLGESKARQVDVRFVAATNADLVAAVSEKKFRSDLLYRLKGFDLRVPPLRDRREDILPLALKMIERFSALERLERRASLSPAAETWLLSHCWPGNVRELANVLHHAVVLSGGEAITPEELPTWQPSSSEGDLPEGTAENLASSGKSKVAPSKDQVRTALDACGGNQSRVAEALGINRARLRELIGRYGLPKPRS